MILDSVSLRLEAGALAMEEPAPTFESVYESEFPFVWRNLRRLGVAEADLRDAAQDVFIVVHRRLGEFEGRSTLRWWLYCVVKRVASQSRRTRRRREVPDPEDVDAIEGTLEAPDRSAERSEAFALLSSLLAEIDEDQRDVLVLSDFEDLTAPEIARMLGCNVNTVYSRLRLGRAKLESAFERFRAGNRSEP